MLKKLILINSAEFDYAEIDLEKDMFFAGDNGTGKTSSIIALFYLFSGDNNSRKLGISADKKSFKEYYFPDERNSFLIYVFEDFFIFMYKQNGEIFKRFSKKVFDIKQIVQEKEGQQKLESFKNIQSYLKDTSLTYLAKSSEYREIIYGQNRKYLDFQITEIKNYDVFVELFNETFNVDKSIVDAQSIKRAIQKSLNIEEKNIEFNYQQYMEEIKKFQDTYLFFRKFEKESDKIALTFTLQEKLLKSEKKIDQLSANMLYRQEIEIKMLDEKKLRLERLNKQNEQYTLQREQKQKSLNRLRERFAKEIANLETEISSIEKLKIKFDPKKQQEQQTHFNQLPFVEKEHAQKLQKLTLLEANVLDALNAVKQEITDLTFKRDNDLKQQKRVKIEQLKMQLAEELSSQKEKLRSEREHTEHRIDNDVRNIKVQIDEQSLEEEKAKSNANELHSLYREKLNIFNDEQFKVKNALQEKIAEQEEQERGFKKELKVLAEQKESLENSVSKEEKHLAQTLWKERQHFNAIIREKKSILFTKEGSFKSFLQQSGLSWEKELYPFMDSSILSMSTEKLAPKVVNAERVLGIELETEMLKQMPTREEAEASIREAKVKKAQLFKLYKEEKERKEEAFENSLNKLEREEKSLNEALKEMAKEIEKNRQEITKINTISIPNHEKKLLEEKEEKLQSILKNIETLSLNIQESRKKLEELKQTLKSFIVSQQKELKVFQEKLKEKERTEQKSIEVWLKQEVENIEKKIEEKEKSRENLSKDGVINTLKKDLTLLQKQVQLSNDAKYYLKEYENSKDFINSLAQRKSRLIMSQQNRNNLENKISMKQDNIIKSTVANEEALSSITSEIKKLVLGLEQSQKFHIEEVSSQKSELYLSELIEQYKLEKSNYKEFRVELKEKLSRINVLKNNPFTDISFNLENFSNFDKFSQDFETSEKLSELKDFKEKKLEILKETSNEKYFNFIKSEIPSKLGSLSRSEDKFHEQVKKINKNLSTIDFSIIKSIKINLEIGNKRSVMTLLGEMNTLVQNLTIVDTKESLFFDRPETNQDLQKIANLLSEIKETLKGGAITLLDTIDLSLEFVENGTKKSDVTQIKNESSTGGTILLKMALAVSILGLYTKEEKSTFFLILDEVSRLHSHNQDLLRAFANSRGFRIVFVTPEPVYAKPDEIKYYKFQRREDNRFEVISLNT